jgi:hypothetical protein
MMVRRALIAVALMVGGAATAGPPDSRPQLTLCVDSPRAERAGVELLRTLLPAMRLALVGRERCGSAVAGYRGWFEQRGAGACFVLVGRGARHSRCAPWLRSARRPLSSMEASGQLATFSVLLQALVAEHELSWLLDKPPTRRSPGGQVAARGGSKRGSRPARVGRTRARLATPPARPSKAEQPAAPLAVYEESAAKTASAAPGPTATELPGPVARSPASAAASPEHGSSTDEPGATWPRHREPQHARRSATLPVAAPAVRPAAPRPARVVLASPAPVAGGNAVEQSTAPVIVRRASRWRWYAILKDMALEAVVGGRWRSGDLWALEVGGSLAWRSFFMRAGYQPAAQWSVGGRPVRVTSVPLAAGWRPRLWGWRNLRLRTNAAMLVERFNVRRTDLPQAQDHSAWDVGIGAGLDLGLRSDRGPSVGLEAGGFWYPAARQIEIDGGPSARLTTLGVRLAATVAWEGWR